METRTVALLSTVPGLRGRWIGSGAGDPGCIQMQPLGTPRVVGSGGRGGALV